jgi:hypothetical protein
LGLLSAVLLAASEVAAAVSVVPEVAAAVSVVEVVEAAVAAEVESVSQPQASVCTLPCKDHH